MGSTPSAAAGMERRVVYYAGRVQGVGFRFTVCQVAEGFAVTGFVQNLPDGRVLLTVEGKQSEVEPFLAAVRNRLDRNITSCDEHRGPASGGWSDFSIQY